MLSTESSKTRLENEARLTVLQRKKGAIVFGNVSRDLQQNTPVAYKVVTGVEEREIPDFVEIENEDGVVERVKTMKVIEVEKNAWNFGEISGMQPAVDDRGLHGNGYEITTPDGSVVTVPRDGVITMEMEDTIKYRPTILLLYQNDMPVMVVLYSWDSMYLPCGILKKLVPGILDDKFVDYIDRSRGYDVDDEFRLTVSVTDAQKHVHQYGPMECSLLKNSDCRGCLSRLLNFSDAGWNQTRNLAKNLCGRGTMYADGNFVIRKSVSRPLFIRFIEVEKWANIRSGRYLFQLLDAILEFQKEHGVGLPEHQLEALNDIVKATLKEEYAAIKKADEKTEIDAYKKFKKDVNAALKQVKSYEAMRLEYEAAEGEVEVVLDESTE